MRQINKGAVSTDKEVPWKSQLLAEVLCRLEQK